MSLLACGRLFIKVMNDSVSSVEESNNLVPGTPPLAPGNTMEYG